MDQYVLEGTWLDRITLRPAPDGVAAATPPQVLWTKHPLPANADKYYNFSSFCMELNELLPSMRGVLAPTDSRLRPDQAAMERGDLVRPSAPRRPHAHGATR